MNDLTITKKLKAKYQSKGLDEKTVSKDPFEQFEVWYKDILNSGIIEPSAMMLSTVSGTGAPSARTVLLKQNDKDGFVFYTNYGSKKAKELEQNPNASLLFLWKEVARQVRISGRIEKTTREESAEYFRIRPRESQLGAWASRQSSVLLNREELIIEYEKYEKEFEGKEIPLPQFWGGYRVIPNRIEFWQGRESRLHDRICYTKEGNEWVITRLSP